MRPGRLGSVGLLAVLVGACSKTRPPPKADAGTAAAAPVATAVADAFSPDREAAAQEGPAAVDTPEEPEDRASYPLLSCPEETTSVDALCKCLMGDSRELEPSEGGKPVCKLYPVALKTARLRVLILGWGWSDTYASPRDLTEATYLLIARDGQTWRAVAEIGREYHPGAFGVDNSSDVTDSEIRTVGNERVAVIGSHVDNLDRNYAGLEVCRETRDQETVCALGRGDRETRCIVIPIDSESGCGPGAEPDPSDPNGGVPEDVKARWGTTSTKLTWSVSKDGKLVVTLASGSSNGVPEGLIGMHKLF